MPSVVIRVDSSPEMGGGHLSRCLALASELRAKGVDVLFVCRKHDGNINSKVVDSGFALRELRSTASPEDDAADTMRALAGWDVPKAIVVDHYGIDATWERLLRKHLPRIVVIDDLADRKHACEVLVDSTPVRGDRDRYAGLVEAGTELLLGPRYALLRNEFSAIRKSPRERDGFIRSIFVSFGAIDAAGNTLRAAKALRSAVGSELRLEVVVGERSPHLETLKEFSATEPSIRLHVGIKNIADLMHQCDMSVTSSGVTALECACMGLPMIVVPIVPNQAEMARSLCTIPCALGVRADLEFDRRIGELAIVMLSQTPLSQALSRNAKELVDGRGAARVARAILPVNITIRRAESEDICAIWEWRNHERVRSMSHSAAPIPWDDHESWYRQVLKDPRCALLIAHCDDRPVAVIRFDLNGDNAVVSIYIAADAHGSGMARNALMASELWLRKECPQIRSLRAETRPDNSASISAFTQVGYVMNALQFRKELSETNGD